MEFDQSVIDKARDILQPIYVSEKPTHIPGNSQRDTHNDNMELNDNVNTFDSNVKRAQNDVIITGSRSGESPYVTTPTSMEQNGQNGGSNIPSLIPSTSVAQVEVITNDIEVKKEEAEQHVVSFGKSKKFTAEEDRYLKLGIDKYGKGSWSLILHDKTFKFHPKRNRDSLRMRAETCGFKSRKKK